MQNVIYNLRWRNTRWLNAEKSLVTIPFMVKNVFISLKHGKFLLNGRFRFLIVIFRDKMPVMKNVCESLEWNNGTETIKTGALVTLNNAVENNATSDYINNMNSAESSTTVYFAYAFIGLRKTCRHCSFHWTDNEPFTYANWYGTEPNTWYYECAHIRTLS